MIFEIEHLNDIFVNKLELLWEVINEKDLVLPLKLKH